MIKFASYLIVILVTMNIMGCSKAEKSNREARELAIKTFDSGALKQGLESILEWHKANNNLTAELLQPGLARAEITSKLKTIGCVPPEEYLILYEWRNGTRDLEGLDYPFLWYHHLMPIERALDERKEMIKLLGSDWRPGWLPIFDFEGEYYFIDCISSDAQALPVLFFFLEEPQVRQAYINITTMIQTAREIMTSGVVSTEQQGFTFENKDMRAIYKVYLKFNPGLNFPYGIE